jgi:hypothetical protein
MSALMLALRAPGLKPAFHIRSESETHGKQNPAPAFKPALVNET